MGQVLSTCDACVRLRVRWAQGGARDGFHADLKGQAHNQYGLTHARPRAAAKCGIASLTSGLSGPIGHHLSTN